MKIAINTRTSGKFKRETINGRSHIVTSMRPIRGDISMNGIFYPNAEVKKSFVQLHDLPAPNGHPKINGVHVSAFKPASMNAFNVGGWVRNPKMSGKEVTTDFVLDETVANLTDDGREIIRRIEAGEKIGVSTGLNISILTNESGKDELGEPYERVGSGFQFDHVAILLNEKAAGDHAGTEMILNTENPDEPIHVVNLIEQTVNEMSVDDLRDGLMNAIKSDRDGVFTWVIDIFPESKQFIFAVENDADKKLFKQSYAVGEEDVALTGSPVEVVLKKEFKPTMQTNEDQEMNKELLILSIIANAHNAYTSADKERLEAMSENQLVDALCVNVDVEQAKQILVDDGFDFDGYESFKTNADAFAQYQEAEKARLDKLKEGIIAANSDYTAELLDGKSEDELNVINKMIEGTKHATRAPEGKAPAVNNKSAAQAVDYSM